MINFLTMQNAIYDWINGQTGTECIWQYQNGIIPDKKFFALRIMSINPIGNSQEIPAAVQTDAGEHDLVTDYNFILEILGFGAGIVQDTINLKSTLDLPDVHRALIDDGGIVSWNDSSPVLDISGVDNDLNEERSSYDTSMRTCDIISDVPFGVIEKVNSEGTFKQPGKPDIVQDINIDSTP